MWIFCLWAQNFLKNFGVWPIRGAAHMTGAQPPNWHWAGPITMLDNNLFAVVLPVWCINLIKFSARVCFLTLEHTGLKPIVYNSFTDSGRAQSYPDAPPPFGSVWQSAVQSNVIIEFSEMDRKHKEGAKKLRKKENCHPSKRCQMC